MTTSCITVTTIVWLAVLIVAKIYLANPLSYIAAIKNKRSLQLPRRAGTIKLSLELRPVPLTSGGELQATLYFYVPASITENVCFQ